jgi:predicted ATP-grasp superfamily ATP-dependent carboligase
VADGAEWFKSRDHLGPIPLDNDINSAQKLIEKYKKLQKKIGLPLSTLCWSEFVANSHFKVLGSFHHSNINELDTLTKTNTSLKELRIQHSTPTT